MSHKKMNLLKLFRPRTKLFCSVLQEYFAHKARTVKDSTIEKHQYFYQNIIRFLAESELSQVQTHEIKIKHMEMLREWLYQKRKCTTGHASRHIEHCQAAFDYAVMMEYYTHNPIDVIKCQRDYTGEPVALNEMEIAKIANAEFSSEHWKLVKDLFLFQCYTGLNYMDLWLYVIVEDRGIKWVTSPLGRGKNNKPYSVELNEYAEFIHEKHNGEYKHITNQGMNRVLKKIAFALNINKELSTSVGRKTYATLRYNQGMSVDGIADELGNTPRVLNKHYLVRGKQRIIAEIDRLQGVPLLAAIKSSRTRVVTETVAFSILFQLFA